MVPDILWTSFPERTASRCRGLFESGPRRAHPLRVHLQVYPDSSSSKPPAPAGVGEIGATYKRFCSARLPTGDRGPERNAFTQPSHPRTMPAGLRLLRPYGARHANRDFLAAAVLAALLTIGFGAWMALRPDGNASQSDALRRFGEAGAALIAAVACMIAAAYHSGRSRFAWVLLGTGALAWAGGGGVGAYYEFIGELLRYPPLTDIGHLVAVPLAVAGIAVFPGRHRGASRIAFLLDGAILAGALVLISWATVLGGVYHAHTGVGASALTGLAYPISDIVMAVMALLLVGRTAGYGRLPLLLVMTGIFANLLADSASVYLTTTTGQAPPAIMATGWVAGFLLMALGAVRATLLAGAATRADDRPPGRWTIVLPYVPVAVATVIAVLKNVSGPPEALLLWDLIVVVALVIARQFIVILDNQTLSQKLALQTAALRDSEEHFRSLVQNSGDVVL